MRHVTHAVTHPTFCIAGLYWLAGIGAAVVAAFHL